MSRGLTHAPINPHFGEGVMRVRLQVRFWGETDIDRQSRPAGSVENDS